MDQKDREIDQKEIDAINDGIPFVDAKIFWQEGYGWTSEYWQKLRKEGWKIVPSEKEPDLLIAQDEKGKTILEGPDKITLLRLMVNFMVGGG